MKRRALVGVLSLLAAAGVTLAPADPAAARSNGGGGRGGGHAGGRPAAVGRGGGGHHFASSPNRGGSHHVGRPFRHHGRSFTVFAGAPLVYASPYYPYYDSSPSYDPPAYDPPAYYPPPASYGPPPGGAISMAPSPPPPPTPSVVEFPSGRYELRGDGQSVPYTWVWIPNPPSTPPLAAPGPPESPPAPRRQLYRWTDDDGVIHLSDHPAPKRAASSASD